MNGGRASARFWSARDASQQVLALGVGLASLTTGALVLQAAAIGIPNPSFESPATDFVNTQVESWQKPPKPDWYQEDGVFLWEQLTGVFRNQEPSNPTHIDNCDGNQALWLFAVPEVGLFQDNIDPVPPHTNHLVFETGRSYQLTVGVIGGGGSMLEGVSLELSLFYRDDASNQVTVATTSVTNTLSTFSNTTHLMDFQVQVPTVKAGDAWAGRKLGVRLLSTVGFDLQGGYWDLDNVRLTSTGEPALTEVTRTNGQIQITLESEPGQRFEMLSSTNLFLPLSQWTRLGTLTNVTGRASFVESVTNAPACFYQARQLE
jgi:hypothetical protein